MNADGQGTAVLNYTDATTMSLIFDRVSEEYHLN